MQLKDYPFIKCLSPVHVTDKKTGDVKVFSCGKCTSCRLQKSRNLSVKCNLESECHEYTYFVTLTYDSKYIPLMRPYAVPDSRGTKWDFVSECDRLKENGLVINTLEMRNYHLDVLRSKLHYDYDGCFPYLSKRELQLFMKRLRKELSKYTDERIRYFACGELGPKHLRPHFHLLLWFDDPKTSEILEHVINQVWRFGLTDCQKVERTASSYVASYVNNVGSLPRLYKKGESKPFCSHSFFLGEKFYRSKKEEVYKMSPKKFVLGRYKNNGSYKEFFLWRSLTNYFFPKCSGYAIQPPAVNESLYRSCLFFSKRKESCRRPYQLAKEIIATIFLGYYDKTDTGLASMFFAKHYCLLDWHLRSNDWFDKNEDTVKRVFGQIYRDLRCSKHFLEFVCNSHSDIEISTKLKFIDHFWKSVDLMNLNSQLSSMEDFSKEFDVEDLDLYYDNVPYYRFREHKTFRQYRAHVLNLSDSLMKHKRQNDAKRALKKSL